MFFKADSIPNQTKRTWYETKKKRKPLCFSLRKDGKSPLAEIERGLRERLWWGSFHSQIRLTRGHKCKIITILTRGHNNLNKRAQVQNNYGNVNVYIFCCLSSTNLYCCSVASQVTWFLAIWIPVVLFRFPHAIPSVNKYFCIFVNIRGLNCFLLPFYWPMNMFSKIHGYNHWLKISMTIIDYYLMEY